MYQALYRKWRPRSFDDVISQPHVTTALRNQIREEKTAHAYLFTGSRGTGKTTCARIFAKTVNCLHRTPEGNPCLECEICKEAERGALSDIIEIDAASNNSVDDIRDLRDGTIYLPERCRYKVYIIDEIHMLSPSAWGALLKVMEEPPEHVKFILATTEVHKVPATIISRCQRYTFHRIRTEDIAARLQYIAAQEQIPLEEDGAQFIAHLSDGGMRDALSLLDQCASIGGAITSESVTATAGVAGRDSVFAILEAVQQKNGAAALEKVGVLYAQSKDMVRLCDELLEQLRNMMLLRSGAGQPSLLTCLPDERQRLSALAESVALDTIFWEIAQLQSCRERMQRNPGKRVELEMALLQLTMPRGAAVPQMQMDAGVAQTTKFSEKLERKTQTAAPVSEELQSQQNIQRSGQPLQKETYVPIANWADILEKYGEVNPAVKGSLAESAAYLSGNTVFIVVHNSFFMTLLKNKEHAVTLQETIRQCLGLEGSISIRAKLMETEQKKKGSKVQNLIQKAVDSHLDTAVEPS